MALRAEMKPWVEFATLQFTIQSKINEYNQIDLYELKKWRVYKDKTDKPFKTLGVK